MYFDINFITVFYTLLHHLGIGIDRKLEKHLDSAEIMAKKSSGKGLRDPELKRKSESKSFWVQAFKDYGSIRQVSANLGIDRGTIRKNIKKFKIDPQEYSDIHIETKPGRRAKAPEEKFERDFKPGSQTIYCVSATLKTLEDVLDYADIDLDVWEVERYTVNKWDGYARVRTYEHSPKDWRSELGSVELWQIKVFLKRRIPVYIEDLVRDFLKDVKKNSPQYQKPKAHQKISHPFMLEVSLFDVHFGKLCWSQETDDDYDLKIAEHVYTQALDRILYLTQGFEIDKVLFPLGQDFFHINSMDNVTAKGTPQDVDSRLKKIFAVGCQAVIRAINRCSDIAPVDVIYVPGNHDPETSWFLCMYLEAFYHANQMVSVDTKPIARKYVKYGQNLIGFTHGNEEKFQDLALIMAGETPELWATTSHREIHLGHIHRRREMKYTSGDTFGPVVVRCLPSISGTDHWHYQKGYVKTPKAAEAFIWDFDGRCNGNFTVEVENKLRQK